MTFYFIDNPVFSMIDNQLYANNHIFVASVSDLMEMFHANELEANGHYVICSVDIFDKIRWLIKQQFVDCMNVKVVYTDDMENSYVVYFDENGHYNCIFPPSDMIVNTLAELL